MKAPVIPQNRYRSKTSTRPGYPVHLGQCGVHIGDIFEHLDRGDAMEGVIFK